MGNSSYFRFDDDNMTKCIYIYILSIITRGVGKLKTHSPTYCMIDCIMDNWENMFNLTHILDKIYTTGQKFRMFGKHNGYSRIWHFNFLQMAWHQSQMNMVTIMLLTCVVLWTTNGICNVQKKYIHRNLQKCITFNISPKISHSSQGIQHYMVNLWKYCVYSIVRYWYHAKICDG